MNKYGYTKVEILIIVILLGLVAFITINRTADVFAIDSSKAVLEVKSLIEVQAQDYAIDHLNIFDEVDTTFILVDDLVKNGYLMGNDEGLITNPTDTNQNFNENKIKLEYNRDKNEVSATFVD